MSRLTLQLELDGEIIHRAEAYSARTGQSLPELVAGYFASLAAEPDQPPERPRPRLAFVPADSDPQPETRRPPASDSLAQRQYRLASHYPGEYVVLVGEHIVCHSIDRQSALRAFDQASVESPSAAPVMVDPTRLGERRPVVRGRSFRRARPT